VTSWVMEVSDESARCQLAGLEGKRRKKRENYHSADDGRANDGGLKGKK